MSGNIKALHDSLSPLQKQFVRDKVLSGSFKPGRLVKLLAKVSQYDRLSDIKRTRIKRIAWITTVIGAITFFIAFFMMGAFYNGKPYVVIPPVLLIVFSIIQHVRAHIEKKTDINNLVRKVALPVLALIKEEMPADNDIEFKLRGDESTSQRYFKRTIKRSSRYGREYNIYHHPWFSASMQLWDGSQLQFELLREVQVIKIKKRSRSGKTKFKTKYKVIDYSNAQLIAQQSSYALNEQADNPVPDNFVAVRPRKNTLVLKSKIKQKQMRQESFDYMRLLQQIHSLYANLIPVKS